MPKTAMPKFTPAPPELVRQFKEALANVPGAETRKMFGYPAAFVGGTMFAGIFQDSIVLRLAETDRTELARAHDARPFEPMPGRVMREYVVVPETIQNKPSEIASWMTRARSYAATLPAKGSKSASKAQESRRKSKRQNRAGPGR